MIYLVYVQGTYKISVKTMILHLWIGGDLYKKYIQNWPWLWNLRSNFCIASHSFMLIMRIKSLKGAMSRNSNGPLENNVKVSLVFGFTLFTIWLHFALWCRVNNIYCCMLDISDTPLDIPFLPLFLSFFLHLRNRCACTSASTFNICTYMAITVV